MQSARMIRVRSGMGAFLLALLALPHFARAQQELRFTPVGRQESLLQSSINCMAQDSAGYLWIGTEEGLVRFDGKNFSSWYHQDGDSTSLCQNRVEVIRDYPGIGLLIGTQQGLCLYNPRHNNFRKLYIPGIGGHACVRDILRTRDQHILIGTINGVLVMDAKLNLLKVWNDTLVPGMPDKEIARHGLAEDQEGNIWMGTPFGGLHIWLKKEQRIVWPGCFPARLSALNQLPHPNHYAYNSITFVVQRDQGLWLGEFEFGVFYFDPLRNELRKISEFPGSTSGSLPNVSASTCLLTAGGDLWMNLGGLCRWNPDRQTMVFYRHDPNLPQSLSDNRVRCIFQDRYGNIWIGTETGLEEINFYNQQFQYLQEEFRKVNPASSNGFLSSLAEMDGVLYMGSYGGGLFCRSAKGDAVTALPNTVVPGNDATAMIWDLLAWNDRLWVATQRGLYTLDPTSRTFHWPDLPGELLEPLKEEVITSLQAVGDSLLWIGTAHRGIFCYRKNTGQVLHFSEQGRGRWYLPIRGVYVLRATREGDVWCMFPSPGSVFYYDHKQGRILTLRESPAGRLPLQNETLHNICTDAGGMTWFCTETTGLWGLQVNSGKTLHLGRSNGLCGNSVVAVERLGDALWISTSTGLACYQLSSGLVSIYTELQGLPHNAFSGDILFQPAASLLYLCNDLHLLFFNPATLRASPVLTQVLVSSVQVGNELFYPQGDTTFSVSSNRNNVQIQFTAPNLVDGEHNHYMYRIDGLNSDWQQVEGTQTLSLVSLSPGDYTIHLKASGGNNRFGAERILHLHVSAPFWRSPWFLLLLVLLVSAVAYLFYRARIRRLIDLQTVRNRIARDLHDDMGSALSSINIYSSMAARSGNDSGRSRQLMENISATSEQLMDMMDDIVWSINPANDSMKNLLSRMRKFSAELMEARGIGFRFRADENLTSLPLEAETRRTIYLIFKESVNNLVKYAQCTEAGVEISRVDANQLKMVIWDNGSGFLPGIAREEGNGLKNMQERAAQTHAVLQIESSPGQGTSITLLIRFRN